ncbi:ribosomal protein S18-alanine N-acetyltransferase [Eubacteriales bacterium KG127]
MSVGNIKIKRATLEDAEGIARIEKECFNSPWSLDEIIRDLGTNSRARYFVAYECDQGHDGRILGYVSFWDVVKEGNINNVGVIGAERRQNLGSMLLEYMLDKGQEEGIFDFTLEVRASNFAAIKLYEKFGFVRQGIRKNYYHNGDGSFEDGIIMWRYGHEE